MKRINTIILVLFLLPSFVFSQQSLDDKLKEIDAYANTVMDTWKPEAVGMAVTIVKDDKVVFQKGYGVRELGKPDKVDENTLFAIASSRKPTGNARTAPPDLLCGIAKLSFISRTLVVVRFMPSGVRMRSRTNSAHGLPDTFSITRPAAMNIRF